MVLWSASHRAVVTESQPRRCQTALRGPPVATSVTTDCHRLRRSDRCHGRTRRSAFVVGESRFGRNARSVRDWRSGAISRDLPRRRNAGFQSARVRRVAFVCARPEKRRRATTDFRSLQRDLAFLGRCANAALRDRLRPGPGSWCSSACNRALKIEGSLSELFAEDSVRL